MARLGRKGRRGRVHMFVALVDDNRVEIESLMRKCNAFQLDRAAAGQRIPLVPALLTEGDAAIKCCPRAALGGGTFHFGL